MGCACFGFTVDCTGKFECNINTKSDSFHNETFLLSSSTRVVDVSCNPDNFQMLKFEHQNLRYLYKLNISACGITGFHSDTFSSMVELLSLDLSHNKIRYLKSKQFIALGKLETFLLDSNSELLIIETQAFLGLTSLATLELHHLHIELISENAFDSLNLTYLKVYDSLIDVIDSQSLFNLYAEEIYLNSSRILSFTETMFQGAIYVKRFVTDENKFCCVRPASVKDENCFPKADEFSSCDDLVKGTVLRPLMWIIGIFSLLSNSVSVLYRLRNRQKQLKLCYGVLVCHLAVSDFIMGIYLLIIAIADSVYRGIYVFHDSYWRNSAWCKLAGVIASLSSETSILFICLITLDRFLVIKFPLGQRKLSKAKGKRVSIVLWLVALILSTIPLLPSDYFDNAFYAQSGVCLALPITRARPPGWGYSVGLFPIFNSFCCLVLGIGQWSIYKEIKESSKQIVKKKSTSSKNTRITINLLLVVTTNCLCWLPVGILGKLSLVNTKNNFWDFDRAMIASAFSVILGPTVFCKTVIMGVIILLNDTTWHQ